MNYELLRYGYPVIVVPAESEAEYVTTVSEMYRNGNATAYIGFLASRDS